MPLPSNATSRTYQKEYNALTPCLQLVIHILAFQPIVCNLPNDHRIAALSAG